MRVGRPEHGPGVDARRGDRQLDHGIVAGPRAEPRVDRRGWRDPGPRERADVELHHHGRENGPEHRAPPAREAIGKRARPERREERQRQGEREAPAPRGAEGGRAGQVQVEPAEGRGAPGTVGDLQRGGERQQIGEHRQEDHHQDPFAGDQGTGPAPPALERDGRQGQPRQEIHRQGEIADAQVPEHARRGGETSEGGDDDHDQAETRARGEEPLGPADPVGGPARPWRGECSHGDHGQAEDDEAGEQAALRAAQMKQPPAVGDVEDPRIDEGQEIHAEELGLADIALEAELEIVRHVRPEERDERGGEQDQREGPAEGQAARQRGGAQEEVRRREPDQGECQAEGLVDPRERLGPEGAAEQRDVAPPGVAEHAMERPEDERGQRRHLVGELAEMVQAIREEGVDHARHETRRHPACDRVREQVRERAARDESHDREQVDDEERGGARRE